MTIKIFFLDERGELIKIPLNKYNKFRLNEAAFEEYAGKTVRAIQVVVNTENRKAVEILRTYYPIHEFNEKGQLDENFMEESKQLAVGIHDNEFAAIGFRRVSSWIPTGMDLEVVVQKVRKLILGTEKIG